MIIVGSFKLNYSILFHTNERNSLTMALTEFKKTEETPIDTAGSSELNIVKNETEI